MPEFVDVLRLTGQALEELCESIERAHPIGEGWRSYCGPRAPLEITHPNGEVGRYTVLTRALAREGLQAVHGTFVYPGSPCVVRLADRTGAVMELDAKITDCHHLTGRTHLIQMAFRERLSLDAFTEPEACACDGCGSPDARPALEGSVLCLVPAEYQREPIEAALTSFGLRTTCVNCLGAALDALHRGRFDHVLIDSDGHDQDAPAIIEAIRQRRPRSVIVTAWDDEDDWRHDDLPLVDKPCEEEALYRVLSTAA